MPFTLFMPKLSPTMEGGTIVKWHKKENDLVKEGDLLFEVATDKATVEHHALDGGYLRKILIPEGKDAVVGQEIAIFAATMDESIESQMPKQKAVEAEVKEQPAKAAVSTAQPTSSQKVVSQEPEFIPEPPLEQYEFEFPTGVAQDRAFASPLARKIAKEKNIDLSTVKGSGPNHRIVSEDLKDLQGAELSFHVQKVPEIQPGSYHLEPLSPMRKVIGKRLQASKSYIPHFYVEQAVLADKLVSAREQLAQVGQKVTYNDFVTRACALALKKHPIINSGFNNVENSIIHFETIDIAIAVSIPGGLITPILRHADYKNLSQLSIEVKKLAKLAKEGKLKPEQYKGGSFTISNLGMYGVKSFTPIINPPQACILGVGGINDEPVAVNGQVIAGKVMNLTLAADHRVIDGVDAAIFLNTLKKLLENPAALLI
jgi:pyruvate dehydrogenase E2 component (dihydrolipoamide acetyltransferase)